jgi:hypothetical protein
MVAAAIRTIFAQPDAAYVRELGVIAGMLGRPSPKVETMLRDTTEDLLASPASRARTGRRSGQQTRSSGSIKR